MENKKQLKVTQAIKPKILYYGFPVILLTTSNEDGTVNISPISSSWALGDYVILGIGIGGKAIENLKRLPECVINIPDPSLWKHVEQLSPFTGKNPVPEYKQNNGYSYQKDKYAVSGLTAVESEEITPTRIMECPLQIEAKVRNIRVPEYSPTFAIIETEVVRVHAHKEIVTDEKYIDPLKFSPLIYHFRHYFGLEKHLGKNFRSGM